ncbi:MAG TPA: hypothetical protein VFO65_11170 [Acidimicrobiales bacterium]|nr:hypothetical protein [Acidimicrobiales bacterium]
MRPRWEKILPLVLFAGAFAALRGSSVYGFIAFGLLGAKLVLSLLSKPAEAGPAATTDQLVTVVIPVLQRGS